MKKFILIPFILLGCFLTSNAVVVKGYSTKSNNNEMTFKIDSIDFRKDLTRVYGKLIGRPHTANRIDKIKLTGEMLTKGGVADDIEGVDFKRWFQWEDNGSPILEIDFPPCNRNAKSATMIVDSPKGNCIWTITKTTPTKSNYKRK